MTKTISKAPSGPKALEMLPRHTIENVFFSKEAHMFRLQIDVTQISSRYTHAKRRAADDKRCLDQAKLASAADSVSKVGMASTSRVTVSASRTRPGPQIRRSAPPSRVSLIEMRTRADMPELSICGTPLRSTMTL